VSALSYSSLAEYQRCGYRFYAELARAAAAHRTGVSRASWADRASSARPGEQRGAITPLDRGTLVHALLERLDFRRPVPPTEAMRARACGSRSGLRVTLGPDDAAQVAELLERFAAGDLSRRLGRATAVRREPRFRFYWMSARPS
jgi:hypothetical protein